MRFSSSLVLLSASLIAACGSLAEDGRADTEGARQQLSSNSQTPNEYPALEGPYMGQEPPGKTAEVFAPGVISTDGWELQGVFAPGMKEFYYVTDSGKHERPTIRELEPTIFGFRFDNNRWHKFTEMPRTGEPFITADGQTMHLAKGRRARTASGWSDVESLGPMFERDDWGIMRLTASTIGTYVFDDFKGGGIRTSRVVDGERQEPLELPEHINGGEFTAHPFIAPDESYLIWDSERDGGYGESDLYISFRQTDGAWGRAINMGPDVNSDKDDFYGSVTPDEKFLMFDRTISRTDDYIDVDIYWMDAQIIEDLRHENESSTTVASPYLGQKPPGLIPEVFAPGIVSVSGRSEGAVSFSPDLDELYFQAGSETEKPAIYFSILEGDGWSPIEKADFTKGQKDEEVHPIVSPDGTRVYFTAYSSDVFDTGVWYVDRLGESWSEARKLDLPIGDDKAFSFGQAKNGNLYYFNISKGKNSYAAYIDGGFPEVMEFEIEPGVVHLFASPDEDYFVAHSTNDEGEDRDLYVSFREQDEKWGTPISLGSAVNSQFDESLPTISPDGKYLFFGREEADGTENIYWASTEVIERLRPKM